MFLFRNSVRSAVVKVINARINEAQKRYTFSLKELIARTQARIRAVKAESKLEQQALLDECVKSVISPKNV